MLEQKGKGSATYYTTAVTSTGETPARCCLLSLDILGKDSASGLASQETSNLEGSPTDNDLSSGLTAQETFNLEGSPTDNDLSSGLTAQETSNLEASPTDNDSRYTYLEQMPNDLRQAVESLGKRAEPNQVASVLLALCEWRDLSSSELATILDRNQVYLLNNYLNPLINLGHLEYVRPGNPSDPHQAYRTSKRIKLT